MRIQRHGCSPAGPPRRPVELQLERPCADAQAPLRPGQLRLRIEHGRGENALHSDYQPVLLGRRDPKVGHMLTP